jgi:hypothetical protein
MWPPWQPIETAPKDGTYILLRLNLKSAFPLSVGRYVRPVKVGDEWAGGVARMVSPDRTDGWHTWNNRQIKERHLPTHWVPLPPCPPEDSAI